MDWEVEHTEEFEQWWEGLDADEQESVAAYVELRVLYAFDPRRIAILLLGGEKTGNDRWYEQFVPRADALDDVHLDELQREGGD